MTYSDFAKKIDLAHNPISSLSFSLNFEHDEEFLGTRSTARRIHPLRFFFRPGAGRQCASEVFASTPEISGKMDLTAAKLPFSEK